MVVQYTMLGLMLLLTSITFAVLMPAYDSTGRRASEIIDQAYPLPRCSNFGRYADYVCMRIRNDIWLHRFSGTVHMPQMSVQRPAVAGLTRAGLNVSKEGGVGGMQVLWTINSPFGINQGWRAYDYVNHIPSLDAVTHKPNLVKMGLSHR